MGGEEKIICVYAQGRYAVKKSKDEEKKEDEEEEYVDALLKDCKVDDEEKEGAVFKKPSKKTVGKRIERSTKEWKDDDKFDEHVWQPFKESMKVHLKNKKKGGYGIINIQ